MASSETDGAAGSYGYTSLAAHRLRRQRSMPAAVMAAFAQCGGGGGQAPRGIWNGRLGGKVGYYHDGGDGEEGAEFGGGANYVPAARPGGVGFVRALWRRIVTGRRKVMTRSGSSVKEQYGHEEYAQNFDEGAAAGEPENLSRSFSARYACRRRSAGLELWDVAH